MSVYKLYILEHIELSDLKDRELEDRAGLNKGDLKNIKRGSMPNPIKLKQLFEDGLGKRVGDAYMDPHSSVYEHYRKQQSILKDTELLKHNLDKAEERIVELEAKLDVLQSERSELYKKHSEFSEKYSKILEELLSLKR